MGNVSRYNTLRSQLLRVELDLAQVRRAFYVDGVKCPQDVRATLEERHAALKLELFDLKPQVAERRKVARALRGNEFLARLIEKCDQGGRNDWVDAARQEAAAWAESQGLSDACNARV